MRYAQSFTTWLVHFYFPPSLDADALRVRRSMFAGVVGAIVVVSILTAVMWLITPRQYTLFYFGCWILVQQFGYLMLMPFLGKRAQLVVALLLNIGFILTTFIFILKLGGIVHSAGIIFVNLIVVTNSVGFQRVKWTIGLFVLFLATILAAALLQPYLTIPPEMTPRINLIFFVVNFLWQSAYMTSYFVYQTRLSIKQEQLESQRQKALNEAKTKLYTNITHEFRTPLTIILGMAKQIQENPHDRLREGLQMIIRNGRSLLTLVNQMLDLQKAEAGVMTSHLVQNDVIPFIAYVVSSFESYAQFKNIRLEFQHETPDLVMDYDPEKLVNILSNLISNAIKFTPQGGQIIVSANPDTPRMYLIIKVCDTGIGIPEDKLPFIYDRFFQVEDETTRKAGGTGIGLALTRELVKLLNGTIEVKSEVAKGTIFTVTLPITCHAPLERWRYEDLAENIYHIVPDDDMSSSPRVDTPKTNLPILLIVEDNPDMVRYLFTCLEKDFQIETAPNGTEGLKKALRTVPDIIISDVMMPEMDGIELCGRLKTDFRTSHIPIILLTAKADIGSRIEGLESGADVYLTKPFSKQELFIHLRKLIELRKRLKARYTSQPLVARPDDKIFQREDQFMQQVRKIVSENLPDENFGIPQLCQELAMSRAQLYRKFEALIDVPVAKYIRTMRLQRAKELLQNTEMNVTEAAFETGFRNLSHFSAAFKEEFGVNPSEIAK